MCPIVVGLLPHLGAGKGLLPALGLIEVCHVAHLQRTVLQRPTLRCAPELMEEPSRRGLQDASAVRCSGAAYRPSRRPLVPEE